MQKCLRVEASSTPKSIIEIALLKDADAKEFQTPEDERKLVNNFDCALPDIQKDQGYGEHNSKLSRLAGQLDISSSMQVPRRRACGLRLWKMRQSNIREKLKGIHQVETQSTNQRLIGSTKIHILTNLNQDSITLFILTKATTTFTASSSSLTSFT